MTNWEDIAKQKREAVLAAIPKEWILNEVPSADDLPNVREFLKSILPDDENDIAYSSVTSLISKIAQGELSSSRVIKIFCKRAAILHQLTNCCSEIFFDRALKRAAELDEYLARNGKVVGPLHGIPISFKDQVNLEGIASAIGFVSGVNKLIKKEKVSLLAEILEGYGAVFYVKTTTPMAMMCGETISNIYGATLNSWNRKLSCAGSSGGEGSLLGARSSLLGFGTDLGGSIRLPCNSQGLFGLRGSSNRLPYKNITNSMENQTVLCSVVGPMCDNIEDLKFITKLIIDSEPWIHDPKCLPIKWRDYKPDPVLSFGFFDFSSYTYIHPPVKRALEIVKNSLIKEGHEIIKLESPFPFQNLGKLAGEIFSADGCEEILAECLKSGEPVIKDLVMLDKNGNPPKAVSVLEYWKQAGAKYRYQQQFDEYLLSTINRTKTGRAVDCLILPLQAGASYKPGYYNKVRANFTTAFNVLDYSVVATPITKADKTVDLIEEYTPLNDADQFLYECYDPELYDGTPVGVQVVSGRYQEEKAIAFAELIHRAINN
ncbi:uncharacterized protein PRCAT00004243001 [Priceomyces carsonii]|uniref:uncharacterized protein n=1 Tax=Priceomyces carsonii TaxID=28549 RepID=UPI002ED9ED0D|nr:unnamed protein product [Priceomyces carsonii]